MSSYFSPCADTTHAHPLTPPEDYDPAVDRLPSIYYKGLLANGLRLKGLQGEGRSSAIQVYCPEIRRSHFNNNSPTNHLDSVSCWRGLDMKQAEEVYSWERVFRQALEKLVAGELVHGSAAGARFEYNGFTHTLF